MRKMNCRLNM